MRKRVISLLLCLVLLVSLLAPAAYAQQLSAVVTTDDLYIGENAVLENVQFDSSPITQKEQTNGDLIAGENVVLDDVQVDDTSFTQPEQTNDDQLTGQASATLDGATVSAYGIPEGGTVTVENTVFPGAEQTLISELEITDVQELFSWEISVQDASGDDWQPEGTVELELSLPDVKLHKYTKVYVLHEADDGTQTYIAAQVTEEGTLSFVTNGFSSFAGFTVDFDYEGTTFSMDGLDSILLSELMDQLKAPVYVEDVASVSFSDPSLLSVDKQVDGDWLLTSLQAFSTTETLTVTMDDGNIYSITVTDEQYATVSYHGQTASTNGTIDWYAEDDGLLTWMGPWCSDDDIIISGGKLDIVIRPYTKNTTSFYMVLIKRLIIQNNADVTIRLSDDFTNVADECVIRTTDGSHVAKVVSGSLTLQGISGGTKLVIDGNANKTQHNPLIQTEDAATSFSATDVIFRNGANGGVWVRSSVIAVSFTNCTFESTVKTTANNGGAIWLFEKELNTLDYVQVTNFTVSGCQFEGNAAANGGAIAMCSKVYNFTITDCDFTNCTAKETTVQGQKIGGEGGAIHITGSVGDGNISGGSTFTNCIADNNGGAISAISDSMDEVGRPSTYSRTTRLEISDTSFSGCQATEFSGGGIYISMQISKLSVSGCDFIGCVSAPSGGGGRGGGAICFSYKKLDGFSGWTIAMPVEGVTISDDYYTWGTTKETIIQEVEIRGSEGDLALMQNCSTGNQGGGIMFVSQVCVGAVTLDYVHIDGCKTVGEGSAIFIGDCIVKSLSITNSLVENCSFSSSSQYDGGTIRTLGSTTCVLYMEGCTIRNNSSRNDGGGLYWNANAINRGNVTECSATLRNCTFEGNTAGRSGGGIYCASVLNIYDCEIRSNTAVMGGGIYQMVYTNAKRAITNGESTELTLDPTTIVRNNTAANGAGIAVICNATASIDNNSTIPYTVKFRLNGASVYENMASENGGGIYFCTQTYDDAADQAEVDRFTKEIMIDNGTIRNNIAGNGGSGNGGGIYMDSSENTVLEIVDGHIHSNTANKGNGGGIYLTGNNAVCTITGGTVGGVHAEDENQVPISGPNRAYPIETVIDGTATYTDGNGGGIAIYGGARIEMTGGTISHNEAYVGGGIAVRDESVMISEKDSSGNSALISHNKATVAGGGIAVHVNSAMEMNAGTISNNEAVYGGGISIMGSTGRTYTVTDRVTNTTREVKIEYGMVFHGSGVIKDNAAVNLVASADTNNSANGGGICLSSASTMYIDGGTITGNKAVEYIGTKNAFTEVYNGGENGGGIAVCQGSKLLITAGQVDDNHAYNGGGIAITGKSTVEMEFDSGTATGGSVSNNTAANDGGGIYADHATVTITDGTVGNNDANQRGGGMYLSGTTNMTMNGGTISGNTAIYRGGGIYMRDSAQLTFQNGNIINNKTTKFHPQEGDEDNDGGGGIFACGTNRVAISGGIISGNTTAYTGGGIMVTGSKIEFVARDSATLTLTGSCQITNNTAAYNGGGIFANKGTVVEVSGGMISGNQAGLTNNNYGGGIGCAGLAQLTVTGGTIEKNKAYFGAGVTITGMSLGYIYGGAIQENTATRSGGGVYVGSSSAKGTYPTLYIKPEKGSNVAPAITKNTANNGGGVYVAAQGKLYVQDSFITYNTAFVPEGVKLNNSGLHSNENLYGAGGGICVSGRMDKVDTGTEPAFDYVDAYFELSGTNMAIYGNTAGYSGDDVFSNGQQTQLTIPQVKEMNLVGYDFKPEGWFEDYNTGDTKYGSDGLNMVTINGGNPNGDYKAQRYRNANAVQRRYMHIDPANDNGSNYINGALDADGNQITDYWYVNRHNAYVAMTLGIPAAADDTVVIDFGNIVSIDVWKNDLFMEQTDFANTTKKNDNGTTTTINHSYLYNVTQLPTAAAGDDLMVKEKDGVYYRTQKPSPTDTANSFYPNNFRGSTNGQVYNRKNGIITFEPEKMTMAKEASFYYMVEHNTIWYYAKVTIIPATSVYFEDTETSDVKEYITYHKGEGLAQWNGVGSNAAGAQDQDRPGSTFLEGLDADNIYGYDSSYASSTIYSGGSAHMVEVSGSVSARASFTFTGTGFDIVSLCSNKSAVVLVNVYREKITDFDSDRIYDDDIYVISYLVDTYYGCRYENGEWIVDPYAKDTLYQVPVIKSDLTNVLWTGDDPATDEYDPVYKNFGYGTYTVELVVGTSWIPGAPNSDTAEFYLDAVRIYNPAGIGDSLSDVVRDAYLNDGEGWPAYAELRDIFITQKDLKLEDTTGVIFIDGKGSSTVDEYRNMGPNNEVYLAPRQKIAFKLNASNYVNSIGVNGNLDESLVKAVHIGIRGLNGGGTVKLKYDRTEQTPFAVSTTDLYYDISGGINQVVTIENAGDTPISISNVKITHTANPVDQGSGNGTVQGGGAGQTYSVRSMFTMTRDDADIALGVLPAEELVEPVVTPKSPALSFNGTVSYNVFFSAEELGDLTAADLGLAVFNTEDTEGTVETADEVHLGATEIDGLYMVATDGVHAKYLGDTKYFKAFAKKADGTYVYSRMVSYSAVDYAMNTLAKSDDVKLKQLVVAMLNYGAEAQKFFGYKTDDLMNKDLTAEDQALLTGFDAGSLNSVGKVDASKVGTFVSNGGFTKKAPAISFKGAFEINYFFTPANAVDGDMTLYFWNEDTYNSVTELTADNADKAVVMALENGTYSAASNEIAAKYLDKTVYVAAVYESNGQTYCSGVLPYSIAAYCQKPPAGVQALATAAAIYGCTAKQYFGA